MAVGIHIQDAWDDYVAEHWYPVLQSTYGQHWRQSFGNEVLAMQQLCVQQPTAAAGLTSLMRGLSISPAKAAIPRATAFSPCPDGSGSQASSSRDGGASPSSRDASRAFQPPPPSGWRSGLIFLGAAGGRPSAAGGGSPNARSSGPEIMHFTGRPSPSPPGQPPPAPFRYGDFEGMQFVPQAGRGVFLEEPSERGNGRLPTDYYEPCDDSEEFDANGNLLGKYELGAEGEMERVARLRRPIKIIRKAKPVAQNGRPAATGCTPAAAGGAATTSAAAGATRGSSPRRNQKKRSAPFQLPLEAAPVKVEPVYCSDATTSEEGSFEASVYSESEGGDGGESGSLRSSSDAVPGADGSCGCPSVDAEGDGAAVSAPEPPAGVVPKQIPHPVAVTVPLPGLSGAGTFNMPSSMAAFKGLLDITDAWGRTPLHVAVEAGRSDIVQSLLYNGADATKCLPIDYRCAFQCAGIQSAR